MASDPQAGDSFPAGLPDDQRICAKAPRIGIVEDHDLVVGSKPQVAFDAGAKLDGRFEGSKAVLRNPGTKMQAAMGKTHSARIERIIL
jgi:hypothetical protein